MSHSAGGHGQGDDPAYACPAEQDVNDGNGALVHRVAPVSDEDGYYIEKADHDQDGDPLDDPDRIRTGACRGVKEHFSDHFREPSLALDGQSRRGYARSVTYEEHDAASTLVDV